MDLRRDALVGASRLIDAAYQRASALSGQPHYVVATVGRIEISPNAPNAVPGKAVLTLEVRSDSDAVLDTFPEALLADYSGALAQVRVTASMRALSRSHPTACSPMIMDAITQCAGQLGYATLTMPSGAGHDAAYMACSGPMGMVFIPCLNGRSHCPEEWIEPEQLLDGTRVLAATLMGLDQALAAEAAHGSDGRGGSAGCGLAAWQYSRQCARGARRRQAQRLPRVCLYTRHHVWQTSG